MSIETVAMRMGASPEVALAIEQACIRFGINTELRVAHFLAQLAHESQFKLHRENLSYSAESLIAVWPSRFNKTNAPQYARKPEKLANKVYAGRIGNGDEASGDGWKFRGGGFIQTTGRANYAAASKAIYHDDRLVEHPELIEDAEAAALAAAYFWSSNRINAYADVDDVAGVTKKVNGGSIGLADRKEKLALAKRLYKELMA